MITVRGMAAGFSAYWKNVIPLSEQLIRSINKNCTRYTDDLSFHYKSDGGRKGFINESAFYLAYIAFAADKKIDYGKVDEGSKIKQSIEYSKEYISRIEEKADVSDPNKEEIDEIVDIAKSILRFCEFIDGKEIKFYPDISGCGFMESSNADVLIDNTLYEFKAGDRGFRSYDLKQLLIYATLYDAEHPNSLGQIGLVNPRRGIFFVSSCDEICNSAGGSNKSHCFGDIKSYITGLYNSI